MIPAAARAALQYGTTEGYEALRETLLAHMARLDGWRPDEMNLTPDDVCWPCSESGSSRFAT